MKHMRHQSVRKKVYKCLCRISWVYRRNHRRCSTGKVFLKFLQYSQENTCVGVFLQAIRFAILLIRDTNTYVFLRILRNFKEYHSEKHLWTTASYFMNKNRDNSSKKKLNQRKSMGFHFRKLTCLQRKTQSSCRKI